MSTSTMLDAKLDEVARQYDEITAELSLPELTDAIS